MRRNYSKPLFFAEEYTFSSSIAKCGINIDTTPPIVAVKRETILCVQKKNDGSYQSDNGHPYGGNKGDRGLVANMDPDPSITIFNDGDSTNSPNCEYDWDGRTNIVRQTGANFAQSFLGTNSDEKNHTPGYNGMAFLS